MTALDRSRRLRRVDIRLTLAAAGAYGLAQGKARAVKTPGELAGAAAARKRGIEEDKGKALSSPRMSAAASAKGQARAKVQQLVDRLKILKKLYSANPREMAKALAQVFKELKAAVKAFKDAGGQELALAGEAVSGAMAPARAEAPADGAAVEEEAADAQSPPAERAPQIEDRSSLYSAVVNEVRRAIGEEGLDFAKEIRGLAVKIQELLETARGQARIRKQDKDTDTAFEDADKALKALHEELSVMESDIRRQVPAAGMRLSIAA
jgi:hypothetical protein